MVFPGRLGGVTRSALVKVALAVDNSLKAVAAKPGF